jgi:TolB-like protein
VSLWSEIKERRITQIVIAYLVGGWIVVSVIDQPVDRGVLPEVVYQVVFTLFLFGILGALIIGWYHGEKGEQQAPKVEIAMLSVIGLIALGTTGQIVRNALAEASLNEAMAESGLDLGSIAVLYFEDLSDGELAPVADGITEALIEQLSQVRSLDVISSNGVLPYRDTELRVDSVARALRVGTIIEGSVEQRGEQLRITMRLVDGASGADIERSVSEIPADQFLAARDSVAESVSRLLRERLGEEVQIRQTQSETNSPDAWTLVQRAERLRTDAEDDFEAGGDLEASLEAFREADALLARAEQQDREWVKPITARAHAAYRRAWFSANLGDMNAAARDIEAGLGHANRALALDPGNPAALEQRATINLLVASAMGPEPDEMQDLLTGALADLEAAVEQDPSLASAHAMLSFLFAGMGDDINAVLSARRALEEDAYLRGADRIYDRLFYAQYELEQFRDAKNWCDEGYSRFPGNYRFAECRLWLAATPFEEPEVDASWDLLAQLDSLSPEAQRPYKLGVGRILVAGVLRRASLPDSAESVLAGIDRSERVDPQRQLFFYEAAMRATTGDPDGALEALRRWAAATPGSTLGPGAETHWHWREIRTRPEFQPFVSR